MKKGILRHTLTWARTGLACLAFLLLASPAFADEWWVLVPDGAVKFGGYNKRQGPFATAEAARAYWKSQNFAGTPNIYSTGTGNSPPPNNSEEFMREREAEERLRAEKELAERERVERERKAEAERQREREFNKAKDGAVKSLKGVGDGGPKLKGAGPVADYDTGGLGLKGVGGNEIKSIVRVNEGRDLGGADSAWKQLNAAAYLAKAAASKSDPSEMYYLATETSKVMNGDALGVALPKFEPMPRPTAAVEPGAEYKEATKLILADVARKATEFKQKAAVVVELAQKKTATVAATKAAQEALQKVLAAPPAPAPAPEPDPATKPKPSALEEAKAALLAAQQAEADATRLMERADAEAKLAAQKINEDLNALRDLNLNPSLASHMKEKYQGSPAPVEPNK